MRSTIDRAGRIVIPKAIRVSVGLEGGTPIDLQVRDGLIEIRPLPIDVRMVKRGSFVVAEPTGEVPRLEKVIVEATRTAVEAERSPDALRD